MQFLQARWAKFDLILSLQRKQKYTHCTQKTLLFCFQSRLPRSSWSFSYVRHKKKQQGLCFFFFPFCPITHRGTTWELSFGGWRCDETFCAAKRQEQNEDQYGFCREANRFWHLAECHAGQLLKMALAHINIPLQQPEYRRGVRAS